MRHRFYFYRRWKRKIFSLLFIALGGSSLATVTDIADVGTFINNLKQMFCDKEEDVSCIVADRFQEDTTLDSYECARMMTIRKDAVCIRHTGYTTCFSSENGIPYWVAWKLTEDRTSGTARRCDSFFPDPAVPEEYRIEPMEYSGSGYDRGHMCPAADNRWNAVAMKESFYMTNICPQEHDLNEKSWERLEEACRRWARKWGEVYVCCGPVWKGPFHETIEARHQITVPEGFFKAVICLKKGKEKGIAFFYHNIPGTQTMEKAALPIRDVENMIDMDLFFNVPERIQDRIENSCNLREWDR